MVPFLVTAIWSLVAINTAHVFDDYSIDNLIESNVPRLVHINNDDLQRNAEFEMKIIEQLSSGSAVLFEDVEIDILQKILKNAKFPTYPNEHRDFFMAHKFENEFGLNTYHTKEYTHYEIERRITSSNRDGIIQNITLNTMKTNGITKGPLYNQYIEDVLDYNKYCISSTVNECKLYLTEWNKKYGFNDQNGMIPVNATSCWGELQQTTYVDDTLTTFSSLIPFSVYIYAEANPATLELLDMLIYIIAEGLHSQQPVCNTNGCRGYAHREIWVNITAKPIDAYNISTYHWIYSQPETENQQTQISTEISDTTTMGLTGSFNAKGPGISFGTSYSWSNSYSQTTDVSDYGVIEDTQPTTSDGKWIFYQQYPVNIMKYPFENFANDWQQWYSSIITEDDDDESSSCDVIEGPDLAYNSQQTSTAIKWNASPEVINYEQQSLNINYFTNIMADVAILWCPDWNGVPANQCNQQQGGSHHCVDDYYVTKRPSWNSNIIQVMNNLS